MCLLSELRWLSAFYATAIILHAEGGTQWYDDCGTSSYPDAGDNFPNPHIVGGAIVRRHEFPYMVSIRSWPGSSNNHFCGGALISPRWVLTAAHCVSGRSLNLVRIVVGEHARKERDETNIYRQKIDPEAIIPFPLYISGFTEHDIALVKLEKNVTFNDGVKTVCAPDSDDNYAGSLGVVTGWGDTFWGSGDQSNFLRWIKVPIQTNADCQKRYGDMTRISKNKLCGGRLEENEQDSCQADSGGPMTIKNKGLFSVVGIVNYGYRCAAGYPGIYNRVGNYVEWISYTINSN